VCQSAFCTNTINHIGGIQHEKSCQLDFQSQFSELCEEKIFSDFPNGLREGSTALARIKDIALSQLPIQRILL
jgi:hypothetical protein